MLLSGFQLTSAIAGDIFKRTFDAVISSRKGKSERENIDEKLNS